MGGECRLLRRRPSEKGRAVPERLPVDPYFVMRYCDLRVNQYMD
jgi:hypothetical protein